MSFVEGVVFDFDGTLVRSHAQIHQVILGLTARRASPPSAAELRALGSRETLRRLNVAAWEVPWLVFRARRRLAKLIDAVEFEPGVPDVLRQLADRGVRLAIVSSNSRANVTSVLRRGGVLQLFDVLVTGAPFFGKPRALRRARRKLNVQPERVVSVGDETRDVEAATEIGMRSIAVGWGLHDPARLLECRPSALVTTPAELAAALL